MSRHQPFFVEPRYRYWDIDHSRYEILRFINKGATGEVVEGLDHSTNPPTRVAIKRISRVFFDSRQAQRIYREIRILRHLDHPNVLKLVNICIPSNLEQFDDLYIIFPAYDHDINMIFSDPGQPLGEIHVRWFLYQLLCGLKYIQSAGILHRDIKSGNILINKKCHLVLADFGLARTVAEEKLRQQHTTNATSTSSTDHTDTTATESTIMDDDEEDSILGMDNAVPQIDIIMGGTTPPTTDAPSTNLSTSNPSNENDTLTSTSSTLSSSTPKSPEPLEIDVDKNLKVPLSDNEMNIYERAILYAREHNTTREMTAHVITRWYRPPELSLYNDGKYTMAIDTWSVGCVFGELLTMLEKGKERKVMFPGSFCAPLTPRPRNMYGRERFDQLQVILDVMGWPSSDQVTCLATDRAREYLNTFERKNMTPYGSNLVNLFPTSAVTTIELLQRLLAFLPQERISINEALDHPFFTSVRNLDREIVYAGEPIDIPLVTVGNMRQLITEEIRHYNPSMKKGL